MDEISSTKQQLKETKELLEESEGKTAALEGEIQKYVIGCFLEMLYNGKHWRIQLYSIYILWRRKVW